MGRGSSLLFSLSHRFSTAYAFYQRLPSVLLLCRGLLLGLPLSAFELNCCSFTLFFPFESFPLRSYSLQFYEWVEDEIADNGSILGSEVREQAQIRISQDFGKYKKFEKLSRRMKKFLGLKVIGNAGKEKRWVSTT